MTLKYNHKIFTLVGPSGVGKNVTLEGVLKKVPELRRLPSFTTRAPRPVEKEGRDYFFVTLEKFQQLINNGQLLEYEEVHPGIFYGTPLAKTKKLLRQNHLVKHIDILGSQSFKKFFPEHVIVIFIKPPNLNELKNRIKKRGEHSEKEIEERLGRLDFEMQQTHLADYQVVNEKLPKCIREVARIIQKEITITKQRD